MEPKKHRLRFVKLAWHSSGHPTTYAAHGCARGPRRAVAHIGVELLLDGVLVDEPSYRAHYVAAIEHDGYIEWRETLYGPPPRY